MKRLSSIFIVALLFFFSACNESYTYTPVETTDSNIQPVANAGTNQNEKTGKWIKLDGSQSYDEDNETTLTYRWKIVSQPANAQAVLSDPSSPQPFFRTYVAGNYVVQLIVNDGIADSEPDSIILSMTTETINSIPVSDAGDTQNVHTGNIVYLDGSGSSDADVDDSLTYLWSIIYKPTDSNATLHGNTSMSTSFIADKEGGYVISLIVNDGTEDSEPSNVIIEATSGNSVPIADAGEDLNGSVDQNLSLDGSNSFDDDNDTLTYMWSIISTPPSANATLTFEESDTPHFKGDINGQYVVQLIVNDGTEDSEPDMLTISLYSLTPTSVQTILNLDPTGTVDLIFTILGSSPTTTIEDIISILQADPTATLSTVLDLLTTDPTASVGTITTLLTTDPTATVGTVTELLTTDPTATIGTVTDLLTTDPTTTIETVIGLITSDPTTTVSSLLGL